MSLIFEGTADLGYVKYQARFEDIIREIGSCFYGGVGESSASYISSHGRQLAIDLQVNIDTYGKYYRSLYPSTTYEKVNGYLRVLNKILENLDAILADAAATARAIPELSASVMNQMNQRGIDLRLGDLGSKFVTLYLYVVHHVRANPLLHAGYLPSEDITKLYALVIELRYASSIRDVIQMTANLERAITKYLKATAGMKEKAEAWNNRLVDFEQQEAAETAARLESDVRRQMIAASVAESSSGSNNIETALIPLRKLGWEITGTENVANGLIKVTLHNDVPVYRGFVRGYTESRDITIQTIEVLYDPLLNMYYPERVKDLPDNIKLALKQFINDGWLINGIKALSKTYEFNIGHKEDYDDENEYDLLAAYKSNRAFDNKYIKFFMEKEYNTNDPEIKHITAEIIIDKNIP